MRQGDGKGKVMYCEVLSRERCSEGKVLYRGGKDIWVRI